MTNLLLVIVCDMIGMLISVKSEDIQYIERAHILIFTKINIKSLTIHVSHSITLNL